jgi:hypothetical protein
MTYNGITLQQLITWGSYAGEAFIFFIMFLYLVFAFVLIRRVKIMNINFHTPHSVFFTIIAKLHFILTFVIIILTFLTLRK